MNNITLPAGWFALILPLAGCVASAPVAPPAGHSGHTAAAPGKPAPMDRDTMWKNALARAPLAATAAFDPDGRLWVASVRDGHITLRHSLDLGKNFGEAVRVNPEPEFVAADGDNRPKLAFGTRGEVYVSWTQSLETPFSGHVRFSRSLDGGRRFSVPITVNDNRAAISHRFEALGVNARGQITLAWLDKRDASAAGQRGEHYTGLAVYYAQSDDRGGSFGVNRKAADHSCECCRIAMAMDPSGTPVIVWRHIYGRNVRDHAVLRLDGTSPPQRVAHDNWEIDACPHHGPALSIAADGSYHVAWFTGAASRPGLFYARSTDAGQNFSAPLAVGNAQAQAGRPQVLSIGDNVWLAWKELDGRNAVLRVQHSLDGGRSWGAPSTLAQTSGASDHPLLIHHGQRVYASWFSAAEGQRVLEVPANSSP